MSMATPPRQQNAKVLFEFTIPELASVLQEEKQRVLTSCWESEDVLSAWRHYWSRPMQWPMIPIIPIALYGAVANVSLGRVLLVAIPIAFLGFFALRSYYKRQLISIIRNTVAARLPPDKPPQPTAAKGDS